MKNEKKAVDKGECVSALFLNLSKAFDTINNDLLLAKLKAYGFSPNALKLMHSYLNNRKQQVQINNKFISEGTVITGVPQGSMDGSLLFHGRRHWGGWWGMLPLPSPHFFAWQKEKRETKAKKKRFQSRNY